MVSGDEPGDRCASLGEGDSRPSGCAVPEAQREAGELLERARGRVAVGDSRDLAHLGAEREAPVAIPLVRGRDATRRESRDYRIAAARMDSARISSVRRAL
jgi:hypothetical protein